MNIDGEDYAITPEVWELFKGWWGDKAYRQADFVERFESTVRKQVVKEGLDPSRLESALRMYVAELDYDIHKNIQCGEEDGLDRYHEEVDYFLRCWHTAGEG